jgi:sugar lactone lactonase YvrE
MPVTNITNCAFGGRDLRTLFITTAAGVSGADEPLAGGVFCVDVGVGGLAENVFRMR